MVNVNEPDDYRAARARPAPEVTVAGAAAAGIDLGAGYVTAALDGDPITTDGQTPLATGDTVCRRPRLSLSLALTPA